MSPEPNKSRTTTLCLTVEKDRVPAFFPLLAQGFTIKAKVGRSVRELLCGQLGLSADYLEHRIQTIFLDGKAVDDVETAVVCDGCTLALSAAMPGMAGATLRSGGVYASMRQQVTHGRNEKNEIVKDGTIVLKLFNLVARDIGPMFLLQGIRISGKNLQDFIRKAPNHFWTGCRVAEIDGMHGKVNNLSQLDWKEKKVFLKIDIE